MHATQLTPAIDWGSPYPTEIAANLAWSLKKLKERDRDSARRAEVKASLDA